MIITTAAYAHSIKETLHFPVLMIGVLYTDPVLVVRALNHKEFMEAINQFMYQNVGHVVVTSESGDSPLLPAQPLSEVSQTPTP